MTTDFLQIKKTAQVFLKKEKTKARINTERKPVISLSSKCCSVKQNEMQAKVKKKNEEKKKKTDQAKFYGL